MTENILESKNGKNFSYARLKINVTTAYGIVPIEGADVSVTYNAPPGVQASEPMSLLTDKNGRTDLFYMPVRRVKFGGEYIHLPRNAKCNITVSAEGYVSVSARDVPIFPDITVIRSFDLISKNKKTNIIIDLLK